MIRWTRCAHAYSDAVNVAQGSKLGTSLWARAGKLQRALKMRRCPKCGTIAADDSDRCGICGEDLFPIQNESVQDAVSNEERTLGTEKRKMEQEELAFEKRTGRTVLLSYGVIIGIFVVGIILTTLRSDVSNITGIALILLALLIVIARGRLPTRGRMIRGTTRL